MVYVRLTKHKEGDNKQTRGTGERRDFGVGQAWIQIPVPPLTTLGKLLCLSEPQYSYL